MLSCLFHSTRIEARVLEDSILWFEVIQGQIKVQCSKFDDILTETIENIINQKIESWFEEDDFCFSIHRLYWSTLYAIMWTIYDC